MSAFDEMTGVGDKGAMEVDARSHNDNGQSRHDPSRASPSNNGQSNNGRSDPAGSERWGIERPVGWKSVLAGAAGMTAVVTLCVVVILLALPVRRRTFRDASLYGSWPGYPLVLPTIPGSQPPFAGLPDLASLVLNDGGFAVAPTLSELSPLPLVPLDLLWALPRSELKLLTSIYVPSEDGDRTQYKVKEASRQGATVTLSLQDNYRLIASSRSAQLERKEPPSEEWTLERKITFLPDNGPPPLHRRPGNHPHPHKGPRAPTKMSQTDNISTQTRRLQSTDSLDAMEMAEMEISQMERSEMERSEKDADVMTVSLLSHILEARALEAGPLRGLGKAEGLFGRGKKGKKEELEEEEEEGPIFDMQRTPGSPGPPSSFMDAYCRYGCGGMSVTHPYYYRPFFGYGYPLAGTGHSFPAGYGGYAGAPLLAAQGAPPAIPGVAGVPVTAGGYSLGGGAMAAPAAAQQQPIYTGPGV